MAEETKGITLEAMGEGLGEGMGFKELYEGSLKDLEEGNVVKGEVLQVGKDDVVVCIGYKSEGRIPVKEFMDGAGAVCVKAGDEVDVLLVRREGKDGDVILSREKALRVKVWEVVEEAYRSGGKIRGKILGRVKGGFSVDIGYQAFLPGSQVDVRPVRDMDGWLGTEHEFKILKYDKGGGNIVLSRRAVLENERDVLKAKTLEGLTEGSVLEGTVKNMTPYGLFIDLGGVDGLVHITDISWGRVGHPSELYRVGDQLKVKVLSYDREKGRVSVGIKQLMPDPWSEVEARYPVNGKVMGRVVSLKEYGVFVELEKGLEGLVHISEMSWTRKIRHPSQLLKVGDEVEVMVLGIDLEKKRISLGMKQLEPNPWDMVAERYPVGTVLEGKVKNVTEFGVFIGIAEGIDGLVHVSDMSWTKRVKHPSELFKKGEEVRAVVLSIDKEKERFSLGIKQLSPDPWDEVPQKYPKGARISGTVTNVTDFGIFVELEEGIEGLAHLSELPGEKGSNVLSRYQVGDVIQVEVIHVSRKDQKIGLSVKKLEEKSEKDFYKTYVNNKQEATSNLGELLKKQMMDPQE